MQIKQRRQCKHPYKTGRYWHWVDIFKMKSFQQLQFVFLFQYPVIIKYPIEKTMPVKNNHNLFDRVFAK